MKFLLVILLFFAYSKSCIDIRPDINSFINAIEHQTLIMETDIRITYNTYHATRLKLINEPLVFLRNLQKLLPGDLCKYQSIDKGINIINGMYDLANNARRNTIYAVRAKFENMRNDQSKLVYNFLMSMYDMIETISEPIRSYFPEGRECVIDAESMLLKFIDTSDEMFMRCFRNVSTLYPLVSSNIRNYQNSLTTLLTGINRDVRGFFAYIWRFSTKAQNDSAAEKFNTVCNLRVL